MTSRRAAFALLLCAAVAGAAASCSKPEQKTVAPVSAGNSASIFAAGFRDLDGKTQPLAQWKGKILVLNFWAPWCPPCRAEMPEFIKAQEQYRANGVVFVGIALDRKDKVQAFADEVGVNYPMLLGENDAAELAAVAGDRLGGLPFTAIFDRSGTIVFTVIGELKRDQLDATLKSLM